MKRRLCLTIFTIALSLSKTELYAQSTPALTLRLDKAGPSVSPKLYGLMTEEINYSYDGGLYAELIRNRIFKDPPPATLPANAPSPFIPGWSMAQNSSSSAILSLDDKDPLNNTALTTSLKLDCSSIDDGERAGI